VSAGEVSALFARTFGGEPEVIASAPARVNLIGEHTDYNGGEVLPIAIARRTYVALRPTAGAEWRAASATQAAGGSFDARRPASTGEWWDYVAGVALVLGERGVTVPACDVAVWSDVPAGAGLSSSAALEVAVGTALAGIVDVELSPREIALDGWRAENEFVGVSSGIMDQFASALAARGSALHVWCDTGEVEQVPMGDAVLIFDTASPRSLRGSAFNTRRAECERALELLRGRYPGLSSLAQATPEQVRDAKLPDPLGRRARHVSEETRRVRSAVAVLKSGGELSGELLRASHESLRVDYECSTPELDWFVDRAMREPGVRGARLTGAGWGGCAIAVGDEEALAAAAAPVSAEYARVFGRTPRTWLTRAEEGAREEPSGRGITP
jgi:galactokinase